MNKTIFLNLILTYEEGSCKDTSSKSAASCLTPNTHHLCYDMHKILLQCVTPMFGSIIVTSGHKA